MDGALRTPNPLPPAAVRFVGGIFLLAVVLGLLLLLGAGPRGTAADPPPGPKEPPPEPSIGGIRFFATWPQTQKPDAAIVLSAETYGFLQPCGCSRPQKGGLERREQFILSLKAKGWPVAGVDLGDIYPETAPLQDQALLKYKTIMKSLNQMGYLATGLGKDEFKVGVDRILGEYALQKTDPPYILAGNVIGLLNGQPQKRQQRFPGDPRPQIEDCEITSVGKVSVAVVGVVGKSLQTEMKAANFDSSIGFDANTRVYLQGVLAKLAASPKKPEVNILLFQGTSEEAKKVAQDFPQFQVILCKSDDSEPPQFPNTVTSPTGQKTLVIQLGQKGRYIGVIGAFKNAAGGVDLHYQLVPLGEEYLTPGTEAEAAKSNPILPLLESYAREVRDRKFADEMPRVPHPSQILKPALNLTYIGSAKCQNCHAAEFVKWNGTHHANAFNALVNVAKRPSNRQFDGDCIVCHTVGFGYKTGYEDQQKTPQLLNVGCESCHGPGSGHAANPKDKDLLALQAPWKQKPGDRLPDAKFMKRMADLNGIERGQQNIPPQTLLLINKTSEMCMRCHNHENDPHFDLYTYWPKINHTPPPPNDGANAKNGDK